MQAILTECWNEPLAGAVDAQQLAAQLDNDYSEFQDSLQTAKTSADQHLHI